MQNASVSTVADTVYAFMADHTCASHHLSSRHGATDDLDAIARLVVAVFEIMRVDNPRAAQKFIEDIAVVFSVQRDLTLFVPQLAIWALTDSQQGVVRYLRTDAQKQLANYVTALFLGDAPAVPIRDMVDWARDLEAQAKGWKERQQEAIRWVSKPDQRPYREAWRAWWAVATMVDILQAMDQSDAARTLGAACLINSFSAAGGMDWYAARRHAGDRQASAVMPIAAKVLDLAQSLPVLETRH